MSKNHAWRDKSKPFGVARINYSRTPIPQSQILKICYGALSGCKALYLVPIKPAAAFLYARKAHMAAALTPNRHWRQVKPGFELKIAKIKALLGQIKSAVLKRSQSALLTLRKGLVLFILPHI